jgi:16S rRNA (guanine966-N2)-methyltransferase
MRIVRGRWAGRNLVSPAGRVRPTAEDIRDEWLYEVEKDLPDARVLELFAGSGAVGLEALSRGAKSCDFVENNPAALHALKANVALLRARNQTRIFKRDALQFVATLTPDSYDIVFADPPYQSRQLDRLVESWLEAPFSRILSVERASDHRLDSSGVDLRLGDTTITTFYI